MNNDRAFVTRPGRRRRGEPLVVLAMVLGSWVVVRAALWDGLPQITPTNDVPLREVIALANPAPLPDRPRAAPVAPVVASASPGHVAGHGPLAVTPPAATPPVAAPLAAPALLAAPPAPPVSPSAPPAAPGLAASPVQMASAHALLWMAAVNGMPLPPAVALATPARPAPVPRWSGDGWLLLRRGGAGIAPTGGLPTYGASQLGAVLRYRLDSGVSPHRPMAYLRLSGALAGTSGALAEREAALGLSARPLAAVPVRAMVEARLTRFAGGATRVRPAASLVTELAPIALPLATRAEFYAQAGYVGGPGGTAFVDGQLRIDRHIARLGPAELRAGAGAWGGAQQGAGRLDLGPGMTLGAPLGPTNARLAMDWRFRLAGNAAPSSGPALTLSAGF